VGFFIAIWLLGFSYAVPLTMLLYLKLAGREKWPITVIMTFCTWGFFYLLFQKMLNVPFPDGLIFDLFKAVIRRQSCDIFRAKKPAILVCSDFARSAATRSGVSGR
jgi:hypothetical protein